MSELVQHLVVGAVHEQLERVTGAPLVGNELAEGVRELRLDTDLVVVGAQNRHEASPT
ncbi:MAG: hypothetical protein ACRDWD_14805 [Acidimicrobiia bacterium]